MMEAVAAARSKSAGHSDTAAEGRVSALEVERDKYKELCHVLTQQLDDKVGGICSSNTLTHSLTHSLTHTHTLSPLTHTHAHSLTYTLTHSLTHTHILSLSLICTVLHIGSCVRTVLTRWCLSVVLVAVYIARPQAQVLWSR